MIDQVKLVIGAVVLALCIALSVTGYQHIKSIGYEQATAECDEKFDKLNKESQARLQEIEKSVSAVSVQLITTNSALNADMQQIIKQIKNTQNIVVKNGKCTPTDEYLKKVQEAINKVNGK